MATSGTLGTLSGQWRSTYTASWSLLSQSTANNESTIRLTGIFHTDNSTTIASDYSDFKLDGTTIYSGSYTKRGAGDVFVKTKDITIKHNDDGSFPNTEISFSTNDYIMGNQSGSGTISGVPSIPRASTVSCSSPNIGDNAIITIGKKSSSFTSTVTYNIGGITGTVATKTLDTVLQLNTNSIKDKIYALIPNSRSISGTVTCVTYDGNTQIGSSATTNFNLYTNENDCRPDISGTVVDTNENTIALTKDSSKLIRYISKPKITINATPKYSSSISSYSINVDGQTVNQSEYVFDKINSNNITISTSDSRKYSNDMILNPEIIDYIELRLNKCELVRTEGTSNELILNIEGLWFNNKFNNTSNILNLKYQYRESGQTSWIDGTTLTPTILGDKFTMTDFLIGSNFDYQKEYQFKIIIKDLLMEVGSSDKEIIIVSRGQEAMAIGEDGGWLYGDWFLNDNKVLEYEVVDRW